MPKRVQIGKQFKNYNNKDYRNNEYVPPSEHPKLISPHRSDQFPVRSNSRSGENLVSSNKCFVGVETILGQFYPIKVWGSHIFRGRTFKLCRRKL